MMSIDSYAVCLIRHCAELSKICANNLDVCMRSKYGTIAHNLYWKRYVKIAKERDNYWLLYKEASKRGK